MRCLFEGKPSVKPTRAHNPLCNYHRFENVALAVLHMYSNIFTGAVQFHALCNSMCLGLVWWVTLVGACICVKTLQNQYERVGTAPVRSAPWRHESLFSYLPSNAQPTHKLPRMNRQTSATPSPRLGVLRVRFRYSWYIWFL